MSTQRSLKNVLISILILLSTSNISCLYPYIEFKPSNNEKPIIIFDKYQAFMYGFGAGNRIICQFKFLEDSSDTTNLDSIPILILDSICFRGECLDGEYCSKPQSWYEKEQENYRKGHGTGYNAHLIRKKGYMGGYPIRLIRDQDLFFLDDEKLIVPSGYILMNGPGLPENCYKHEVTVELWLRLLDRTTGDELASESKNIRFRIKQGRRISGMS